MAEFKALLSDFVGLRTTLGIGRGAAGYEERTTGIGELERRGREEVCGRYSLVYKLQWHIHMDINTLFIQPRTSQQYL